MRGVRASCVNLSDVFVGSSVAALFTTRHDATRDDTIKQDTTRHDTA